METLVKTIKILWSTITNLAAIVVILAMFHVVNGPFETVVVVGLVLIYNQLMQSGRGQFILDLNARLSAHQEFITLARFIRPLSYTHNPETHKMEAEFDNVTPHEDAHKDAVEEANSKLVGSFVDLIAAAVIWGIAVWNLFAVIF